MQQRYWDGTQWTTQIRPSQPTAAAPTPLAQPSPTVITLPAQSSKGKKPNKIWEKFKEQTPRNKAIIVAVVAVALITLSAIGRAQQEPVPKYPIVNTETSQTLDTPTKTEEPVVDNPALALINPDEVLQLMDERWGECIVTLGGDGKFSYDIENTKPSDALRRQGTAYYESNQGLLSWAVARGNTGDILTNPEGPTSNVMEDVGCF